MITGQNLEPDPRHQRQDAYVRQWRADHPERLWQEGWTCPLCRIVLQENALVHGLGAMVYDHQRSHGADWLAFCAALGETDEEG